MQSKLAELERRLGGLHVEDLHRLTEDSSSFEIVRVLTVFETRFRDSFRVVDALGGVEMRDKLALILICLLRRFTLVSRSPRGSDHPKNNSALVNGLTNTSLRLESPPYSETVDEHFTPEPTVVDVVFSLTEALRICLREKMTLHATQSSIFLQSLAAILSDPISYGPKVCLSTSRCLLNLLNDQPERITLFVSLGCMEPLIALLLTPDADTCFTGSSSALSSSPPLATSASPAIPSNRKSHALLHSPMNINPRRDLSSDDLCTNFASLLGYVLKVIYMMTCQCPETIESLGGDYNLLRALICHLCRTLLSSVQDSPLPTNTMNENSIEESLLSSGKINLRSLSAFPFDEPTAIQFQTTARILFSLDAGGKLERQFAWKGNAGVSLHPAVLRHVVIECLDGAEATFARQAALQEAYLAEAKASAVASAATSKTSTSIRITAGGEEAEVSYRTARTQLHANSALGMDDIKLSFSELSIRSTPADEKNSQPVADAKNESSSENNNQNGSIIADSKSICTEAKNWSELDMSTVMDVSAQALLLFVITTTLTIAPLACGVDFNPDLRNVYYAGTLAACEDAMLPLLMDASEATAKLLFGTNCTQAGVSGDGAQHALEQLMTVMRPHLPNSLVRILSRALLQAKRVESSERGAILLPVLVSLSKMVDTNTALFAQTKALIFPAPYHRSMSAGFGSKPPVDPIDSPPDTVRHELLKLITSLDSTVKRCASELVYKLCNSDSDEYVYRTGFGNAVALLQLKGLC